MKKIQQVTRFKFTEKAIKTGDRLILNTAIAFSFMLAILPFILVIMRFGE